MRVSAVILSLCILSFAGAFAGEQGVVGQASVIVEKYGQAPGGVILESTATGFRPITSVSYDKKANRFTLNGSSTYTCPVQGKEFRDLLKALMADDCMGVSMNREHGKSIVFGKLSKSSGIAKTLFNADRLLRGVVFGVKEDLGSTKLPNGYKPAVASSRPHHVAACMNFTDYRFGLKPGTKQYVRTGFTLDVILMPIKDGKTADGGHVMASGATQGLIAKEDQANADFVEANQDAFEREVEVIGQTAAYGEAVSFARLLRDSGADLKPLLNQF